MITEFGLQSESSPTLITAGADGNVWFTDQKIDAGEIGRITPQGAIAEFGTANGLQTDSQPKDIVAGPDGNLWFSDSHGPEVGELALQLPPSVATGAASAVTSSSASVAGAVNPVGGAVSSIAVQYGTSTAYGSTAAATPGTLPAAGTPSAVSAALGGLPAGTVVHYRVVATNAFGTTPGPDETFTTAPLALIAPPPGRPVPPTVSRLAQSHSKWRAGRALAHISRKALPVGTTFSFALSEPAAVSFTFRTTAAGRKVKRVCVKPTRANRGKRRCARTVTAGRLSFSGHAGVNRVAFDGRLSKARKLGVGRYTLVVRATAAGHASAARTLSFTIAK
ncbi:MAG TPA: hypothetical protein VHX88_05960 [Solirubrobacteraceae bacterium]|nr:hypothetical protein [Solirubrobacteraceae bacterium]